MFIITWIVIWPWWFWCRAFFDGQIISIGNDITVAIQFMNSILTFFCRNRFRCFKLVSIVSFFQLNAQTYSRRFGRLTSLRLIYQVLKVIFFPLMWPYICWKVNMWSRVISFSEYFIPYFDLNHTCIPKLLY